MLNPQSKLYRWGPIDAYPLFLYYSIEPAFRPLKDLFGTTYSESLIVFKDGRATWMLHLDDLLAESQKFVRTILLEKKNTELYLSIWNERTKTLESVFSELDSKNLTKLSNRDLEKMLRRFNDAYYQWFTITISHELVTSSLEPLVSERLKHYSTQGEETHEIFATLSSPEVLSFYRQEQMDLIRILTLPKKDHAEALVNHQKKYFWIYNSYAKGQVLAVEYFRNELEKVAQTNFRETLKEIEKYVDEIKERKQSITSSLNLSTEDRELVRHMTHFAQLLDERKMTNFKADHYIELFVQEFSKRNGLSPDELKMLLPEELADSLKIDYSEVTKKREECFVVICSDTSIHYVEGRAAHVIAQEFDSNAPSEGAVIQGTVASTGNVRHFRGTAKIVLSIREISKVSEGDVLITTMTSPDFVIGMKKAGAIITDIGGILSHAAIVSREFGKPCIVGTEIATKTIKDGDVVELHCAKGVVRIVRS
jgi:phosphohistidine swiveling domain-containing protein